MSRKRHRECSRPLPLAVVAFVAALVVAVAPAVAQAPAEVVVELDGTPVGPVEVASGGTVHFHAALDDHEIVSDDGTWTTGLIAEGGTASLSFGEAGEYAFHCTLHANETGTIVVRAATTGPPPGSGTNEPPEVSFVAPADGATVTGVVTVSVRATDADAGPQAPVVELSVGGGEYRPMSPGGDGTWLAEWDTTGVAAGNYALAARATDGADYGAPAVIRVSVAQSDDDDPPEEPPVEPVENEPPTVTVRSPEDGARLDHDNVAVFGNAEDPDAEAGDDLAIEISIDGRDWTPALGDTEWSFIWPAHDEPDGEHEIRVRAFDGTDYSDVVTLAVLLGDADVGAEPPEQVEGATDGWRETALNVGWITIVALAVVGAWAWASSKP